MRSAVLFVGTLGCLGGWALGCLWTLQVTSPQAQQLESIRRELGPEFERKLGEDAKKWVRFVWGERLLLAALPLGLAGTVLAWQGFSCYGAILLFLSALGPAVIAPQSLIFTSLLVVAGVMSFFQVFRNSKKSSLIDSSSDMESQNLLSSPPTTLPGAKPQWIKRVCVLVSGLGGAAAAGWMGITNTVYNLTIRDLHDRELALKFPKIFPGWLPDVLVDWFLIASMALGLVGAIFGFFRLGRGCAFLLLAGIAIPTFHPPTLLLTWPLILASLVNFTLRPRSTRDTEDSDGKSRHWSVILPCLVGAVAIIYLAVLGEAYLGIGNWF